MQTKKLKRCPKCKGTTDMTCPECGGDGYDIMDGGQCEKCHGTGELDCIYCKEGYVIEDNEYDEYDEDNEYDEDKKILIKPFHFVKNSNEDDEKI